MSKAPLHRRDECPRTGVIFPYLDGELPPADELEFEGHFAGCTSCKNELDRAKDLLIALESGHTDRGLPEIPADFARRVSMAAVNDISGIRTPRERFVALAICCLLLLTMTAALGGSLSEPASGVSGLFNRWYALFDSLGHLLYSIAVSIIFFLRVLATSGSFATTIGGALVIGLLLLAGAAVLRYTRPADQAEQP